jgi:hypothetical protein
MSKRNLKKGELKRMLRAANKHKHRRWKAVREMASTPAYTVHDAAGHHYVHDGDNRVAGPFSNADAWRWIERHTVARRYGQ